MRVILFIMDTGIMLLLYSYYVRMHEFKFIRVVIGYSLESLLRVTAQQEHTVSVVLLVVQCWLSVSP